MRIYKRGNIYWTEFIVDNKRYQLSCRTKDKKLAEEIAAALQADVVRNKFNIPAKYGKEYEFKNTYLAYIKSVSNVPKTIMNKNIALKHFLPVFENRNITDIVINDIKTYQLQRKLEIMNSSKNIGKRESEINFDWLNKEILILSNFFNFCIEKGYLDKNPAQKIKKLNTLSRLKTLSDSDIEKLIAGATNKLTQDLITFLIYTGCRKGEALNLKWDDVDMQNDVIAIKDIFSRVYKAIGFMRLKMKTKYDRYIPISGALKKGFRRNKSGIRLRI